MFGAWEGLCGPVLGLSGVEEWGFGRCNFGVRGGTGWVCRVVWWSFWGRGLCEVWGLCLRGWEVVWGLWGLV